MNADLSSSRSVPSSVPRASLGLVNWRGYVNPALDRLIEESGGIDGERARLKALQRIVGMAMDDLVVVPLYEAQLTYGIDTSWTFEPRPDGLIDVSSVRRAP